MHRIRIIASARSIAALIMPAVADAQVGGLRRLTDRAREAVGAAAGQQVDEAPRTASAPAAPPAAEPPTLQITAELLTRFEVGLRAESADRAEVARLLGPEVRERYRHCTEAAMMGPEIAVLVTEFAGRFDGAEPQQAMAEYEAAFNALIAGNCGPDPGDPVSLRRRPAKAGREAAGLEEREYSLLKERTLPFCASGSTGTRVPGDGKTIFFVYSENEVEALRPRCPSLLPLREPEP